MSNPDTTLLPVPLPDASHKHLAWGRLYGCSRGLAITSAAQRHDGPLLLVTPDTLTAAHLEDELRFFGQDSNRDVLVFPDWETLPYDVFSPHEDIISQRLKTLHKLPSLRAGVLIVPVTTLMQRLAPRAFLEQHSLILKKGQRLEHDAMRERLQAAGYNYVSQVMAHGEFSVRGSLIDLFPMGSSLPYRLDLFDDEVESIRTFDPESQRSIDQIAQISLLPAREFPIDDEGIKRFRQNFRIEFEGDPNASTIYRDVSNHLLPPGIEYYLPLFFENTETFFDYLPANTLFMLVDEALEAAKTFQQNIEERYEQRRHNVDRPLLKPERICCTPELLQETIAAGNSIDVNRFEIERADGTAAINFPTAPLANVSIQARAAEPGHALQQFIDTQHGRTLFIAESTGRREYLIDTLHGFGFRPHAVSGWSEYLQSDHPIAITVAPIEDGVLLSQGGTAIITENQLFSERAQQSRRRKPPTRDADAIVRNLTDLHEGSPVVHEDHGVGRYRGLTVLHIDGHDVELLMLEYAGGDKLYVPVASLQLVSRYTGADADHAPLHKLGGEQWKKIKRKAAQKAHDVAAELLEIHARRAARVGYSFDVDNDEYAAFAATFPFEETPDQARAITEVLADMRSSNPMDRVVCGDVGFGKTEVAMRAAFVAAQSGKQVVVLVPTTLLAQQHYQNFRDRFADWPVRIEALSRFRSKAEERDIIKGMADGKVDIVIGTHKLLQDQIKLANIGLVIVDEEHRFGVRHKERLKKMRAELDMLTLTATPIPRTLNMSLSGLRDLSIIATAPAHRHTIKTFVNQWDDGLIVEACQREIKRGGQVYFLHNEVKTIDKAARDIKKLLPEATVKVAHGQLRERELEQIMLDFYHQRFNVLVCTTIIESGIDLPNANTIIMNRADKLGLAQLHQIRGRVGRSHHRAYAYLLTPSRSLMTPDAIKRIEAIESLEDLGVGFTLATHDLEIRGAGELLGQEQSGQIHEIGFSMYNELLERAVKALRAGDLPDLDASPVKQTEVDLGVPALLPNTLVPDVHMRLILYKRIATAETLEALRELQVEMIDRFGLLPETAKNLFETAQIKLRAQPFGILKVEVGSDRGRILFDKEPNIDTGKIIQLIQSEPQVYRLDGMDKLRFQKPMESLADRIDMVVNLLESVSLDQAA